MKTFFEWGWTAPEVMFNLNSYQDFDGTDMDVIYISVLFGKIKIYRKTKYIPTTTDLYEGCPCNGFYFYKYTSSHYDSIFVCHGHKRKVILMPWALDWYRTSILQYDGSWSDAYRSDQLVGVHKQNDLSWKETYPYEYVTKSGEVQKTYATLYVSEREWRPHWFKWTRMFRKTKRTIDVDFKDEIGEDVGSWKGGVVGCDYEMQQYIDPKTIEWKWETPEECLRRMENERRL